MAIYPAGRGFGDFTAGSTMDPTIEQATEPPKPSPVDLFLNRMMSLFGEEEADQAPEIQPAYSPPLGMALGAAYSRTPGAYPTLEEITKMRLEAAQANQNLPYARYQARAEERGKKIDRYGRMVNLASQMELREAQAKKALTPTVAGGGRYNPDIIATIPTQMPDGSPGKYTILRTELAARLRAGETIQQILSTIEPVPQSYADRIVAGLGPEGMTFGRIDPHSGRLEGTTGNFGPAPTENTLQSLQLAKIAAVDLVQASRNLKNYVKNVGTGGRIAQDIGRRVPVLGQIVSSYYNPSGEVTASLLTAAGAMSQYLFSGKQINEEEYRRLREFATPTIGESWESSRTKLLNFFGTLATILNQRQRVNPQLVDPEIMNLVREEMQHLQDMAPGSAAPSDSIDQRRSLIPRR